MIDFNPTPAIGELHEYLGRTWQWAGFGWKRYVTSPRASWTQPFIQTADVETQFLAPNSIGFAEGILQEREIELVLNFGDFDFPSPTIVDYI